MLSMYESQIVINHRKKGYCRKKWEYVWEQYLSILISEKDDISAMCDIFFNTSTKTNKQIEFSINDSNQNQNHQIHFRKFYNN